MSTAECSQRCLYEILAVDRTATPDEIRAAYRKLALKFHPDKTVQSDVSQEVATARFQEILGAYNVLSDPHERSWYDYQRSKILHSSPTRSSYPAKESSFTPTSSSSRETSANSSSSAKGCDFDINIWPYFHPSVYSGYGDTDKGFFKVYGDLFQTLFQQEKAFSHRMGADTVPEAPLIGNLNSPYAEVSAFYKYWLGFSTVKDFTWVDKHRVFHGKNRETRRRMEEENKKLRKKAKREYNETVRQLAEFVKKRDKRVFEGQLQRKREEKATQALRREKLEEKLRRARKNEEQEWARDAEAEVEGEGEGDGEGEGEEEEEEYHGNEGRDDGSYDHVVKGKKRSESGQTGRNWELYCSRKFKSAKQWKNHKQSKKHKDELWR